MAVSLTESEGLNPPRTAIDGLSGVCHITDVTLFRFTLRPGTSIFDQVVFAATKAFVSGEFQPGQPFPSVILSPNFSSGCKS